MSKSQVILESRILNACYSMCLSDYVAFTQNPAMFNCSEFNFEQYKRHAINRCKTEIHIYVPTENANTMLAEEFATQICYSIKMTIDRFS